MENYYTVEITAMSAKDLKNVNLFSKMDVYAVLTADDDPCSLNITPVHYGGGTCPEWNHPLKFNINRNISAAQDNNICLRIQLKSKRSWLGDKDVGEVVVRVNELHDDIMAGNTERSCQVRTTSRNAEGVLTFKFAVKKVDEPPYAGGPPPPPVVWSGPPWGPNPPQKKDRSGLRALGGLLKACYYGNNLFGNVLEGFDDVASAGFDAAAD